MNVDWSLFSVRRNAVRGLLVSLLVTLLVAGASQSAGAQEEALVTDRPDITESSAVVGQGRFQVETSTLYQVTRLDGTEEDVFSTPTLLRVGLGTRFELRFASDLYARQDVSIAGVNSVDSGLSPLSLGLKFRIADGEGTLFRPAVAFLAHTELPSGASVFKVRSATGQFIFAADSDINEDISLGVNVGAVVFEADAGDVQTGALFSAALGYGITESMGAFLEFAGSGMGLAADDQLLILDAGVTYLFGPNMQVDVAGGIGLNDRAVPDSFVTLGFSFRSHYRGKAN